MKARYLFPLVLFGILPLFAPAAAQQGGSRKDETVLPSQKSSRFADLVRADFFAGMMGDQARFERAMQLCEANLAKNPEDAEAMVWHGSGLLVRSAQARRQNDVALSDTLFQNGLDEMKRAVALAPENPSVLLPQGATLLSVSAHPLPFGLSKSLLQQGVQDFERVLELQAPYFVSLPLHARGELLSGLADGWHRLGDESKSREYHQRIVKECAGSSYANDSQRWLDAQVPADRQRACQGCHTK